MSKFEKFGNFVQAVGLVLFAALIIVVIARLIFNI